MAFGLSGYNATPLNYTGEDGILFHVKDDLTVFLALTATTDMKYTSTMQVTTQPVQSGQTITDNVQEVPDQITINGVVVVDYLGTLITTLDTTVVEDFINTLQTWRKQRQILTVLCKDGITLENAICTTFEASKDVKISNGLNVTLTFQNADFVVQIGQTTANVQTGSTATTKDGAVTKQKDSGTSTTSLTASQTPCQYVKALVATGDTRSGLSEASARCDFGGYVDSTGVHYNESGAAAYIPKSVYTMMGGNANKIE